MSKLIDDFLANPIFGTIATAIALAAVALWIAAAWWAWRDAARRTDSSTLAFVASGWIILSTPLLLPLALAVFAVVRPPMTAADRRTDSLVATLAADAVAGSACPGCAGRRDPDWVRCPRCATWLSAPCSACGEWSPSDLELCPFCGREGLAAPVVEDMPVAAASEVPVAAATVDRLRRTPGLGLPVARRSGFQA